MMTREQIKEIVDYSLEHGISTAWCKSLTAHTIEDCVFSRAYPIKRSPRITAGTSIVSFFLFFVSYEKTVAKIKFFLKFNSDAGP